MIASLLAACRDIGITAGAGCCTQGAESISTSRCLKAMQTCKHYYYYYYDYDYYYYYFTITINERTRRSWIIVEIVAPNEASI